jgi:hypothetical protein
MKAVLIYEASAKPISAVIPSKRPDVLTHRHEVRKDGPTPGTSVGTEGDTIGAGL